MPSIDQSHIEFKLEYNKINSNHKRDFPAAYIDIFINKAQFSFVERFYSGNSGKAERFGFETTQQRTDMLSDLVISFPKQPVLNPVEVSPGIFEVKFSDLKYPYCHLIRAYADTSSCGVINVTPKQHDDFNIILNDFMQRPKKLWKRAPSRIASSTDDSGSSLYIHTNEDFNISEVKLEYIKKPRDVFFGGYDSLAFINGDVNAPNKSSERINSEIVKYHDILIKMAVQEAASSLSDIQQYQIKDNQIQTKV